MNGPLTLQDAIQIVKGQGENKHETENFLASGLDISNMILDELIYRVALGMVIMAAEREAARQAEEAKP